MCLVSSPAGGYCPGLVPPRPAPPVVHLSPARPCSSLLGPGLGPSPAGGHGVRASGGWRGLGRGACAGPGKRERGAARRAAGRGLGEGSRGEGGAALAAPDGPPLLAAARLLARSPARSLHPPGRPVVVSSLQSAERAAPPRGRAPGAVCVYVRVRAGHGSRVSSASKWIQPRLG